MISREHFSICGQLTTPALVCQTCRMHTHKHQMIVSSTRQRRMAAMKKHHILRALAWAALIAPHVFVRPFFHAQGTCLLWGPALEPQLSKFVPRCHVDPEWQAWLTKRHKYSLRKTVISSLMSTSSFASHVTKYVLFHLWMSFPRVPSTVMSARFCFVLQFIFVDLSLLQ